MYFLQADIRKKKKKKQKQTKQGNEKGDRPHLALKDFFDELSILT